MSPVRQEHLLRMIEEAFDVVRRIRGRRQDRGFADVIRDADAAATDLLGPQAAIAARLDPASPRPSSTSSPKRWRWRARGHPPPSFRSATAPP